MSNSVTDVADLGQYLRLGSHCEGQKHQFVYDAKQTDAWQSSVDNQITLVKNYTEYMAGKYNLKKCYDVHILFILRTFIRTHFVNTHSEAPLFKIEVECL